MAGIIGFRAGLKDAHHTRPPYVWSLFRHPQNRPDLLKQGWNDVAHIFLLALCGDIVIQLIMRRWVYPGEAAAVAVTLAIIPYVVIRSLANRAARKVRGRN